MTIGGCEKRDCPAFDKCTAQYRGSRCAALRYSYGLDDPKTNYDRIISKSPEELAKYIAAEQISGVRTFLNGFDQELEEEFANEVNEHWHEIVLEKLDWLRQEATDAK